MVYISEFKFPLTKAILEYQASREYMKQHAPLLTSTLHTYCMRSIISQAAYINTMQLQRSLSRHQIPQATEGQEIA